MALKSVSSTATSLLGIPVTSGAGAGSSAANAADASNAAGSPGAGGAASGVGAAGVSFVQLLTQSASTSSGTEVSAKTTEVPAQEKSTPREDESGSDSVAMALAMVSQSLAQAASAAAQTTAAAGGNVSAAKSDAAQVPAALAAAARVASAAAAAGTIAAGAANGGTAAALDTGAATAADNADGADGLDNSAAAAQKLFALLTQGEDVGLATPASKDPAQSGDSSQNDSPGNSDNGATAVSSSTAAGHLSVGSHFSVHGANDAKATVDVKSPVGSTAWADELGGKITWMAHQGIESASLRLSPAHLGPVEVRISVQDGGASVWFGAAQADTRAALEQALPRLREMFSTQGLTLADANVSREPPRQQQQPTTIANGVAAVTGVSEISAPQSSASLALRIGLLDTYA